MLPGLDSVLSPFSPHHSSSSRRERRQPTPEVGCRRLGPPLLALETGPDPCLPAWTTCSALGHACFPQLQPRGAEVTDEVRKGDSGIPELHVRLQRSAGKEFGPSPAGLPDPPAHCRRCPGLPRAPSPPVRLLRAPRALPCWARSRTHSPRALPAAVRSRRRGSAARGRTSGRAGGQALRCWAPAAAGRRAARPGCSRGRGIGCALRDAGVAPGRVRSAGGQTLRAPYHPDHSSLLALIPSFNTPFSSCFPHFSSSSLLSPSPSTEAWRREGEGKSPVSLT